MLLTEHLERTLLHGCGMLYLGCTCLEIVSELTLARGNNSTYFPKAIGDVKGCILVKSSRHPEMKIAFLVPLNAPNSTSKGFEATSKLIPNLIIKGRHKQQSAALLAPWSMQTRSVYHCTSYQTICQLSHEPAWCFTHTVHPGGSSTARNAAGVYHSGIILDVY